MRTRISTLAFLAAMVFAYSLARADESKEVTLKGNLMCPKWRWAKATSAATS